MQMEQTLAREREQTFRKGSFFIKRRSDHAVVLIKDQDAFGSEGKGLITANSIEGCDGLCMKFPCSCSSHSAAHAA
jgi:hypothetical protein